MGKTGLKGITLIKHILFYLLSVVLALPLALIITFLLWPFWSWFEGVSGIESMGHSGPASWCFAAVYAVILSLLILARMIRR